VFLNKKVGMAAMQLTFEASSNYVDSSFVLSDCGKQVTIDFSSHSAKVFGERQAKLNTIIQELLQLENQMTEYRASPEFKKAFK
jgi:hypothetical protein